MWSKGYLCPKGASLASLHHDEDRLRVPMVREGDEWREVSWDEAFARCEELLRPIVEQDGIAAVTAYIGNPAVHNYSLSRYTGAVAGIPRMPVIWSAGTVDQWPKNLACAQLFGNPWSIPIPDIQRTDLFLVMGANPQASQGSLFSCPDILGEMKQIRRRGGRTIVVDPRRTGTAEKADEWIPIVPGMDAAFLLAIVHVLDAEGPHQSRVARRPGAGHRRGARGGRTSSAPRRWPSRAVCRPSGSAGWPASSPRPNVPSCTAGSACATRSSAPWRRGRSTSSTC